MKQLTESVYWLRSAVGARCYWLEADDRVAIIDPGLLPGLSRLTDELRRGGRSPNQVTDILLTHHDSDHAQTAATWQKRNGARVWLGIEDVAMIGVAKGPHHGREGREVFHFPDGRELTLPVNSPLLFFIQRLRDEAHRFAIGAHRQKRAKAMGASPLDEVPGIGPARKKALLMHFGTARAIRNASLEDLQRAPGVSAATAQAVYDFYHG